MVKICVLCGTEIEGHGNNPAPLNQGHGMCCDGCNTDLVIPTRLHPYIKISILWETMMRKRRKFQSARRSGMSLEDFLELHRRLDDNNYSPQK